MGIMRHIYCKLSSITVAMLAAAVIVSGLGGCSRPGKDKTGNVRSAPGTTNTGELRVLHAADLVRPFDVLEQVMERRHPQLDVIREAGSSEFECRRVADLGARADIIAVTDHALIEDLLIPEYTEWSAAFARNRLVLIYGDHSKYRATIDSDNWSQVLLRDDVSYGYADPAIAPVGYRTLLSWKLADRLHGNASRSIYERLVAGCPEKNVRPHCHELFALIQTGTIDYAFHYESMAAQDNLQYLRLPARIDLGDPGRADFYSRAEVTVGDRDSKTKTGMPILYAATILKDAGNEPAAVEFLRLLLGEKGRAVLEEHEFNPIPPTPFPDAVALPRPLRALVNQASSSE